MTLDIEFTPSNRVKDYGIEVGNGNVAGVKKINKFGESTDVDNHITDIWDGADGATSTDVHVQPTAARIHTIVSASDVDSDSGGVVAQGAGLRTLRVWYLPDWDTAETTEDVVMDGTTGVAMSNAAVFIHRMRGLTYGANLTNTGIITATAATDSTISAAILAAGRQTQMAIYGVSSLETIHVFYAEARVQGNGTPTVTGTIEVRQNADLTTSAFTPKHNFTFDETVPWFRDWSMAPKSFAGPCIVKIQCTASTTNQNVIASFDAYVTTN